MSAHPLGLRIASKKLNAPFIGVSQYYFYNLLKQSIVIRKNTEQLTYLLAMPINRLNDFEKNNAKASEIVYSRALPTSVLLKAKQLFESQYTFNRQRLFNTAISHAGLLQQQFEKKYNSFTLAFTRAKAKNLPPIFNAKGGGKIKRQKKQQPLSTFLLVPTKTKQLWLSQTKKSKKNKWFKHLLQTKKSVLTLKNLNPYSTLSYYPFLFLECLIYGIKTKIQNNKKIPNGPGPFVRLAKNHTTINNDLLQNINNLKKPINPPVIPIIKFKNKDNKKKKKKRPTYTNSSLDLLTLSKKVINWCKGGQPFLLNASPNKQKISSVILLAFLAQLSPINRALYQYSTLNKQLLPFFPSYPITATGLAKEMSIRQKPLYVNSVPANKVNISTNAKTHGISHVVCVRPPKNLAKTKAGSTALHFRNISKKCTKQIENFRSNVKMLVPLKMLIHRNFLEPTGIHYISALNYQLAKSYCNKSLKNCLFARTSKDYLRSSYMRSQQGLIRSKDAILFEFAYTKSSLIKLNLKKTNSLMQQLLETGHAKLWLRKISSIRL